MKRNEIMILSCIAVMSTLSVTSMPVRASETNDMIESSFHQSYIYTTYLNHQLIWVHSKEGVVTLTGTVDDQTHRIMAEETVAKIPGVTRVDSRLVTKAEVATMNEDNWTGKKVKFSLLLHRNVSASKTSVKVNHGIVTLKGEASSVAQKDLTGICAKNINSVFGVNNEMTID